LKASAKIVRSKASNSAAREKSVNPWGRSVCIREQGGKDAMTLQRVSRGAGCPGAFGVADHHNRRKENRMMRNLFSLDCLISAGEQAAGKHPQ